MLSSPKGQRHKHSMHIRERAGEPMIERKSQTERIVVIADDLTGSMDTGLQFAVRGLTTVVGLRGSLPTGAEIAVVNTETRHLTTDQAAQMLTHVIKQIGQQRIYKKVDSTMRGNVGAELATLSTRLIPSRIVICPAFPQAGRTVRAGILYVHDVALAETAFRHDPLCPMTMSYLPNIIAAQTDRAIATIPLEVTIRGAEALAAALRQTEEPIIVVDAESEGHLLSLAAALVALGTNWIPCGSAGLAEAWARTLHPSQSSVPNRTVMSPGPVLAVCGSQHPATRSQVLHCVEHGQGQHVDLGRDIENSCASCNSAIITQALPGLVAGEDVVLSTMLGTSSKRPGHEIAQRVAHIARDMLSQARVGGIFLTGGDTAMAVCQALGVTTIRILDEVEPGLPIGELLDGPHAGMPIITKAGGFGGKETLLHAIRYLRHR